MKFKYLPLLILSFVFIQSSFAQKEISTLNIKYGKTLPHVVPIGSLGFIIFQETKEKKTKKISLTKYNTNLKLEKSSSFNIKKTETIAYEKYYEGKYLYFICTQVRINTNRYSDLSNLVIWDFTLIRIDVNTMETTSINIIQKTAFHIKNLIETPTNVYLIGDEVQQKKNVSKSKLSCASCGFPIIFTTNYTKPKVIKFDFNKKPALKKNIVFSKYDDTKTKILNSDLIDSTGNIELLLHSNKNNNQKVLFQQIISEKCENATELNFPKGKSMLNGKVINTDKNKKLISGIVIEEKNSAFIDPNMPESSGIFLAVIKDNKLQFNSIVDYPIFKNFKLLSKEDLYIVKKYEKENKTYSANVSVKIHDIIERDSIYLIMGEAFANSFSDANPSNVTNTFEGIKWLGGFILAFDKNGKYLWDNALTPIEKILGNSTSQRVLFLEKENGDLEISGTLTGKIQSKIIHLDGTSEIDTFKEIVNQKKKSLFKQRTEDQYFFKTQNWYDNYNIGIYYKEIKKRNSEEGLEKGDYLILKKLEIEED